MPRAYDDWEKLVGAVLKREELKRIALCESFSSSISVDYTFDASLEDAPALYRPSSQSNLYYGIGVRPIALEEIKRAIRKYRAVRQGGLGIVLKGWIDEHALTASTPTTGMAVAVKWNHGGLQEHQDWLREIRYFSQLRHPNLVKLIAYCLEQDTMISVHEFITKGSLDLFTRLHQSLTWATRIKVAIGAARGLSFLHGLEIPIIHRDFNTTNILLDGNFNAKLSNYCLDRDDANGDVPCESSKITDAYGYSSPEYITTGYLTTKCNVYSFGVVLLELLFGCQVLEDAEDQKLADWAKPYLGDTPRLFRVLNTVLPGQYPRTQASKVAKLASRCLSLDPKSRPRMSEIVVALEQL